MRKLMFDGAILPYTIADDVKILAGDIVALNADGKAVKATNTSNINVIGYAFDVIDDVVEVVSGIVSFANDTTNPVTRNMRTKPCYVADSTTVCSSSTNSIVAGLVVDVDDDEVFVDTTTIALAVASNIVNLASLEESLSESSSAE